MLSAIVRWSLVRPRLVALAALFLAIYGAVVLSRASFDVFPDFVPAQAEIQTEAEGFAADQVEQLVTRPVERAVAGAAGVQSVRSDSIAGLSIVTVVFADGSDPFRARQIVAEALSGTVMPTGAKSPVVAPLTSSTMDLLKIGFTSPRLDPMALRDLVETTVQPRLLSVPGVARATLYGGLQRRIEVQARPEALAAKGLSFDDLIVAVRASTNVAGGGQIDTPQQRLLIEPQGQAANASDIAKGLVSIIDGVPVCIGDVAEVRDGAGPLKGDALVMAKPGVLISLSSQYGANTLDATRAVEAAMSDLTPALKAQGVEIQTGLHRPANFIEAALKGLSDDLAIGAVLIGLVLFVFLRDPRTVLVSFVSIPLALLSAVIVLNAMGMSINTMTLGGLAVALGVVVDDAVIDVENIVRRLRANRGGRVSAIETILAASLEVRAPVIYATLVVAFVLLPVLMLHGLQGSFFRPLAAAFIVATLASLIVALVVTPPLTLLLLQKATLPEEPTYLVRAKDWHAKILRRICELPRLASALTVAAIIATAGGFATLNSELLPAFREGHFVLGIAGPPGTSLAVMRDYGVGISKELLAIPGIQTVEQQIGRAEGGEDTWGSERSEFHVELKPGLSGGDQDHIQDQIRTVLGHYPGLTTEVLTFLGDRIGESLTGETASLAIGVYGQDLDVLDQTAAAVAALLEKVPGAVDVQIQTPPKAPSVRVELNFAKVAQQGFTANDVLTQVQTAYRGASAAQIFKADRTIDIAVTLPEQARQDPEAVGSLLLRSPTGQMVPLQTVARVYLTDSRTIISHAGGMRRQVVTTNPPPSQVAKITAAAQTALKGLKLPPGVHLEFSGTAEATRLAQRELLFNIALAGVGVVALLLVAFGNGRSVGLIVASAPFAMVGGVLAVAATGSGLSLGALVGFVTLFGVAARNAILLISHADHLVKDEGQTWSLETIILATRERVLPILMTALVTALGLAPLALETGQAGREIQGPMALVILGGLITSTLMSLLLLPALIWRFGRSPKSDPDNPQTS